MGNRTQFPTTYIPDDPLNIDANYRFGNNDREKIDDQILGIQQVLGALYTQVQAAIGSTGTLTTADNSFHTIATIALDANGSRTIQAFAIARKTDGTTAFLAKQQTYQRTSGGAPTDPNSSGNIDLGSDAGSTGYTMQITNDGLGNALVQVKGASATTINWSALAKSLSVTT